MTDATPLDPDEVRCRKCGSNPGEVCRYPNGDRARAVHAIRRRDAANGGTPAQPENDPQRPTIDDLPAKIREKAAGSSTFTSESASAAAKRSAQERRRRRAEAAAQVEAKREQAQREALEQEAEALARDAVRYDRDRALLKRQTLDAAGKAYTRLIDGLEHLRRPRGFDADGKPETDTIETYRIKEGKRERVLEADGTPATHEEVAIVGAYDAGTLERLAKIAASTLISLRLEEDKPTGITRDDGRETAADVLGAAGVDELLSWAKGNLPGATP
jgi:hypothetical protein